MEVTEIGGKFKRNNNPTSYDKLILMAWVWRQNHKSEYSGVTLRDCALNIY